jgi:hypothetical protein
MAQVTLNPSKDCHMTNGVLANANQNTASLDIGEYNGGANDIRRTLIQFDLSSIPSGSTITGVTLRMYDSGSNLATNTRTMRVFRCRRTWGETTVTWNKYDGTNSWTTAGADDTTNDREGTDVGSISMPGTEVAGYNNITVTASAVQDWLTGSFSNNGFLIRMDTETDDLHRFDSREGSNQPQLVVDYELPVAGGFYYMSV